MSKAEKLAQVLETIPEDKLDKLLSMLGITGEDHEPEPERTKPKSNITEDFKVVNRDRKGNTKQRVKSKGNSWSDTGECREEDKIIKTVGTRNRPKASLVEVLCNVCGRKSKISSSLPRTDYYRCENCVGR